MYRTLSRSLKPYLSFWVSEKKEDSRNGIFRDQIQQIKRVTIYNATFKSTAGRIIPPHRSASRHWCFVKWSKYQKIFKLKIVNVNKLMFYVRRPIVPIDRYILQCRLFFSLGNRLSKLT
jgi:hypothetical protein